MLHYGSLSAGAQEAAMIEPAKPSPKQSVTIPEQSAPTSAASIPSLQLPLLYPAALAAGRIDKLKAGPGTMIKRPCTACHSDAEPAPKKQKTKPPTATMAAARSFRPLGGVDPNMPLGPFPGVPKRSS